MNDRSFEKLVDILKLPLEEEVEFEESKPHKEFLKSMESRSSIIDKFNIVQEFQKSPKDGEGLNKSKNLPPISENIISSSISSGKRSQLKERKDMRDKSPSPCLDTLTSEDYIQNSYNDTFTQATKLLYKIIQMESNNITLLGSKSQAK